MPPLLTVRASASTRVIPLTVKSDAAVRDTIETYWDVPVATPSMEVVPVPVSSGVTTPGSPLSAK